MDNIFQIAWLIPVLPLLGFLILGLGRNFLSKSLIAMIGCSSVFLSFVVSIAVFSSVSMHPAGTGNLHYFNFIDIKTLHVGFDLSIDRLSGLFLLIITGIGFLIHVYSSSYMNNEASKDYARYFAYLNLFVFSMLLLVMGSNFIIMFIGWEGVGLCSYLLIGYWFRKADYNKAAQKAFVMNRIGDLGFLLAIFWLIARVGSVSYDEVFSAAGIAKLTTADLSGITLLLLLGATGKSAQIPLYTWLPDAMAGPTPVSALIHAATMVTAGIYMVARANIMFTMAPFTLDVISIIGLATSLLAASIAIKQNDIKKVLAYSTVSQLGLMFVAVGAGAYMVAVFHVITHAFFKALLFLGSGSVIHAMGGDQDMRNMGGLKKQMPITNITVLIGCLAIAGIPPLSGFFSKDQILLAAFNKNIIFWLFTLFAAVMTAFYMFRLYAMTFLGSFRGTDEQNHHLHESPIAMTLPLIVLAVFSVSAGWIQIPGFILNGGERLASFLEPVFQRSNLMLPSHELSHATEYLLMGGTISIVILFITFAIKKFSRYHKTKEKNSAFGNLLENKWYVDELYDFIIARPLNRVSLFFNDFLELKIIDGFVNGIGRAVNYGGRQLRWLQSGQVGFYVLLMTIGLLLLFVIKFYL